MPAELPRNSGISKAWTARTTTRISTARMLGAIIGAEILRSTVKRLAPEVNALSSRLASIARNGPTSSRKTIGAQESAWMATRPSMLWATGAHPKTDSIGGRMTPAPLPSRMIQPVASIMPGMAKFRNTQP